VIELINELKFHKSELLKIEEKYENSYIDYYRCVIRKEDRDVINKISKIPDDWKKYVNNPDTILTDSIKNRLSDVKKRMSWEMKIQSLYLASITTIEKNILSFLLFKSIDRVEIEDSINSINYILLEIDNDFVNIKHLILSLAKRSISDFYYLMSAYIRFNYKRKFIYENEIKNFLLNSIENLESFAHYDKKIDNFIENDKIISHLFIKSSNKLGWRLDEIKTKSYFDKNNSAVIAMDLYKLAREAYKFKNKLKDQYLFLKYYYNDTDGKEYRLNFIMESLQNKVSENKISDSVLSKFNTIFENFKKYKIQFDVVGLQGFGPEKFMYIEVLQFLYKSCKIIEFYYLRNMQYDNLKSFRDEIQLYVENEIFSLS